MAKDPFTGREIEFGQIIRVGRQRKDGKYPVTTIFKSTGSRFNNIMTKAQIDEQIQKGRRSGNPAEVYGYVPPPHDPEQHATKKTARQLDAEIADILFTPGQRVKCSYRGDHVGKVLAVDDPRAWAGTLAFPGDKPNRMAIKEHVLRHPRIAVKSIPVLYKFGVQWDNRDCLSPV